jgi:UDP-GlcNAc3NAcA epimerase
MIKIITVIGARPQIIKAAALSRAIQKNYSTTISEKILHTGQHYDENMSDVFINELGIPKPDFNLNVGSGKHGQQTAQMIIGIEAILLKEEPDFLVLYGDTNSTLAGAIAASKLHIPVVHIEAGLRSFNKQMPEEINRIMCDHASTLLFSPTKTGFENLKNEGFSESSFPYTADHPGIFHCGDIMLDNAIYFEAIAEKKSQILNKYKLQSNPFVLATIHRNTNTDDPEKLSEIFEGLIKVSEYSNSPVVLPLHPRTKHCLKILDQNLLNQIDSHKNLKIIEPVSYLDMIQLENNASLIITDSGGVQKEAYFFSKACLIVRPQTEWVEILDTGSAKLVEPNSASILKNYKLMMSQELQFPSIFGDGKAAEYICDKLLLKA